MSNRKEVIQEFTALSLDYKAEVLAAEILANGTEDIDIGFKNLSTFKRPFSKDVEALTWDEEDDRMDKLMFLVNREGLYDMIPQNLTHYDPGKVKKGHEAFIADIKYQRQQEAFARKFFQPIEEAFFNQRLQLETLEREFDSRKNADRNRELFGTLYGDSAIFEDMQVLTLLYLLPLAHKIRADADLISYCLTRIMGYEVRVTKNWESDPVLADYELPGFDEMRLGMDSILVGGSGLKQLHYHLSIEDISARKYPAFMEDGNGAAIIDFLVPYFFPAASPVHLHLNLAPEEQQWVLSDGDAPSYFGYNTYL